MPILEWNDGYSVGVSVIDEEHKQLVGMINKAYDSVKDMEEEKVLGELVKDMCDYAAHHFVTEEKLMIEHGYPASEGHMKLHADFAVRAETLNNFISSGDYVEPVKVFKFLADWLKEHILKTDKAFGEFLNKQGVK